MNLWTCRSWMPMLLKEVEKAFDDSNYLYEIKYDGIRVIIFVSPSEIMIKSRYNVDVTSLFPELKKLKTMVKKNTIFDGEIIMLEDGKVSFSKLQTRIHLKNYKTIEYLSSTNPVMFVCFDLLYEDKDLTGENLIKRKTLLDKYPDNDVFFKSKYIFYNGIKLFENIKELNMEGIVAKKITSKYEVSKRSDSWVKIKNYQEGIFVVLGYINKEESFVISLLLGEKKGNKLYYVGKVSVGKKRQVIKDVLKEKEIDDPLLGIKEKNVTYIKPRIKCLVKYLEKTKSGSLRQPFVP